MIIVHLAGGLGNQMFQYALGCRLAERQGSEVLLEASQLPVCVPPRPLSLDMFNIRARMTSVEAIFGRAARALWTLSEAGNGFFPEVLEESHHHRDLLLQGWWQSEKYFADIEPLIRRDFTFKATYNSPYGQGFQKQLTAVNSVCLHVRRRDYLDPHCHLAFIDLDYYKQAADIIQSRVANPHFFVFSDDISWCRQNIRLRSPVTFVSSAQPDELHPVDDLYLMTLCKHFVIANSTYSWWAAWLCPFAGKIVVAPQHWFRQESDKNHTDLLVRSSADLIPESWIRI